MSDILKLNIKDIKYDKDVQLNDISEYEFKLVKVKTTLETEEEVEMYLKMVNSVRIKESIFCYWCAIYEEEMTKINIEEQQEIALNKVLITELNKKKYYQSVFLEIENNRRQILETGTEIDFLNIISYIKEKQNKKNKYEKLLKYFKEDSNEVLLVGLKIKKQNRE